MKFVITEEEKSRILNMHKNAIKRQYLREGLGDPGTINAQAREQTYVDQGMNYIGFTLYGENNTRNTYYYNCTASFDSTPEEQIGSQKAGAIFDGDGNVKTATELGMTGDYNSQLRTACQNIYTWIANKRKTFCADPKNKTKKNYGWNCPQTKAPEQVASAEGVSKQEVEEDIARAIQYGFMTKKEDPTTGKITYTATGKGRFTIGLFNMYPAKGQDITADVEGELNPQPTTTPK
jgi:hypothetical protein